MPSVTVRVTRGFTAVEGVPIGVADFNAGFLPVVELEGDVLSPGSGGSELKPSDAWVATATGSSGAYAVTLDPAPDSLVNGLWCGFIANHANHGAATLNVNGLSSGKAIVRADGQALSGGEIVTNQAVFVMWNTTRDAWVLWSQISKAPILYAADTGAANAYVVSIPALTITSLAEITGLPIIFKAAAGNTGASTLALNGLTATAIKKKGTTDLSSNDIQTGGLVTVAYDGSVFQLTSFVEAPALPSVGAAGSLTYPYSMTVDAQGRVTAKAGGVYTGTNAVPASGAAATFTHGLGRTPAFVRVVAVMGATTEHGFTAGDEVPADQIVADYSASTREGPLFQWTANGTTITVARVAASGGELIATKTGASAEQAWTAANWTLKVYAW